MSVAAVIKLILHCAAF